MKKLLLLSALLIFACSSDDSDNDNDNNNNSSQFEGEWSGTFSGGDNGTWTAAINSNGDVSGTAHSTTFSDTYDLEGYVSASGQFQATFGTSSVGGEFIGQLNGNSGSGTWVNTGAELSGTWSGNKN
jgi:hypothetical protein